MLKDLIFHISPPQSVGKDTALLKKNKGFGENVVFHSQRTDRFDKYLANVQLITLLPAIRFLFVVGAAYI